MKKALITGITGSGGSYLAEYLVNNIDIEVHGISRWHSTTSNHNLSKIINKVILHECDLVDLSSTIRTLKEIKPDYIFHLAAYANVRKCFVNPIAILNNNINNTINLFEAIRLCDISPIVQHTSTSEVYGQVEEKDCPIKETNQLNPVNIYAVSKLTQEKIALSYFYSYKIPVIVTRMFAYINPRRKDIFSTAFAIQIAQIEAGKRNILEHGNLESIRTLIDVREAMQSYWVAITKCIPGEIYNIAGNTIISVKDILDILIKQAKVFIPTQQSNSLVRPVDVTRQIADISKFTKQTNWQPTITLDESLCWLLNSCRNNI